MLSIERANPVRSTVFAALLPRGQQRLLLINLGRELHLAPAPEPMLAPPEGQRWEILWTSENIEYGGSGTPKPETDKFWRLQGNAALALMPAPNGDKDDVGDARNPNRKR